MAKKTASRPPECDVSYEAITQRNYGVYSSREQSEIRSASTAVVGIGCDGGLAATILARVGVGHLTLIDPDVVEVSNLNRQPLCTVSSLGMPKVHAARRLLHDFNPFVVVNSVQERLDEHSTELLRGHDVVLQCVDNHCSRVAVHRAAYGLGIPVVSMTGQPPFRAHVSTFMPGGATYEAVWQLPSLGLELDDKVRTRLKSLKFQRATHAAQHGATRGWAEDFSAEAMGWGGEAVGWAITPERAYITATLQAHEAMRIITHRPLLAEAPRAFVIDLLRPPHIVEILEPADGQHWDPSSY